MNSRHKIAGWITGIAVFFACSMLGPESRCRDGWASPSIGRPGACSHHGGVRDTGWFGALALAISAGIGLFTSAKLEQRVLQKDIAEARARLKPPAMPATNGELLAYALAAQKPIKLLYKGQKDFEPHRYTVAPLRYSAEYNSVTRKREDGFRGHCLRTAIERSFVMSRIIKIELHEA